MYVFQIYYGLFWSQEMKSVATIRKKQKKSVILEALYQRIPSAALKPASYKQMFSAGENRQLSPPPLVPMLTAALVGGRNEGGFVSKCLTPGKNGGTLSRETSH